MRRKVRTPQEIARPNKKTFSLYLSVSQMDELNKISKESGASASELVDEAVRGYLEVILDNKKPKL